MREYLSIGSSPCEEDCAQVGDPDYRQKTIQECKRFIELIRKKLGEEPPGALLKMKWFDHDFGSYAEVVCWYDINDKEATDYAFKCESDAPARWEDEIPIQDVQS